MQCVSSQRACYQQLVVLDSATLAFATLHCSLEVEALRASPQSLHWHCKPKMHICLELAEFIAVQDGNPRDYWTYRDEGCVGEAVGLASHRGGTNSALAHARRMMNKYRAQSGLPVWLQ